MSGISTKSIYIWIFVISLQLSRGVLSAPPEASNATSSDSKTSDASPKKVAKPGTAGLRLHEIDDYDDYDLDSHRLGGIGGNDIADDLAQSLIGQRPFGSGYPQSMGPTQVPPIISGYGYDETQGPGVGQNPGFELGYGGSVSPGFNTGHGHGVGSVHEHGVGQGIGPGMGPGIGSGIGSGIGYGISSDGDPGIGSGSGYGHGFGPSPGYGHGIDSSPGYGQGVAPIPGYGQGVRPGIGSIFGPNFDPSYGPGNIFAYGPNNIPSSGNAGYLPQLGSCPPCQASVYDYCSQKMFHDFCCCEQSAVGKPSQCRNAQCNFLFAKSCFEHNLIRECCCKRG